MLSPRPRTPHEIKSILEALSGVGAVLIGGQAINVWSLIYEQPENEPWRSSRPYTSFDADALADRPEMMMAARASEKAGFRIEISLPETPEESALNTGLVHARKGGDEFCINLLHRLGGLNTQEVRETAVTISWERIDVLLLHPLLCVESKAHSLSTLPQDKPDEPRQDRKHLILAVANLREHLVRRSQPELAGAVLRTAQRLVDLAYHQLGCETLTRHGIDVLDGIPWAAWRPGPISALQELANREPEFRREIQRRIEMQAEVDRWLADLKRRK